MIPSISTSEKEFLESDWIFFNDRRIETFGQSSATWALRWHVFRHYIYPFPFLIFVKKFIKSYSHIDLKSEIKTCIWSPPEAFCIFFSFNYNKQCSVFVLINSNNDRMSEKIIHDYYIQSIHSFAPRFDNKKSSWIQLNKS